MTTASWSTRVRMDSDATYQEFRDEFITKLGLMSTYLTADETNLPNGTTANARAGTNAEQGYAVYHLNDSLHGTAPVYIRFGFGTGTGTTSPRIQITVGTSTNGSGVLGGTALTTIRSMNGNAAQATDTARQSYMCAHNGFLGINWKIGASSTEGSVFITRTCDSAGAISATGAMVVWGIGSSASLTATQSLRFASTAAAYTARTAHMDMVMGFLAQFQTSTLTGSNNQFALAWTWTPTMAPLFSIVGLIDSELNTGNTASLTVVGTSARTYIGLAPGAGSFNGTGGSQQLKFGMLWE